MTENKSKARSIKPKPLNIEAKRLEAIGHALTLPNYYVEQRTGHVLSRGLILKLDNFPSNSIKTMDFMISGGPNYRQINKSLPLCAVGQPTVHGIRTVLNTLIGSPFQNKFDINDSSPLLSPKLLHLSKSTQHTLNRSYSDNKDDNELNVIQQLKRNKSSENRKVIWINLREEPVVYLNNRPFVLREETHPFRNMKTFHGITWKHLFEVETRLQKDILIEARQYSNILIHEESQYMQVIPCWEAVTPNTIQTFSQVFSGLKMEGYNVEYYRIPITPEDNLSFNTVDSLYKIIIENIFNNNEPFIVYNCQIGSGRSTLGSIYTYLVYQKLGLIQDDLNITHGMKRIQSVGKRMSRMQTLTKLQWSADEIKQMKRSASIPSMKKRRGQYEVISKLLRLLTFGSEAKQNVDKAIHACGQIYNLHHKMNKARLDMENATNDDEQALATSKTISSVSRYITIICFAAFLEITELPDINTDNNIKFNDNYWDKNSFSNWMNKQKPIIKVLNNWNKIKSYDNVCNTWIDNVSTLKYGAILSKRKGTVLSSHMILKSDLFTKQTSANIGIQSNDIDYFQHITFRYIAEIGVATCSQPHQKAIELILKSKLKISKNNNNNNSDEEVIWIELREDPVMYIHNIPHVLRYANNPFKKPDEFTAGLTDANIDDLLNRLKSEIKDECNANDGQVLLHEEMNHKITENWFKINKFNNEVLTANDVFKQLKDDGYKIGYKKLPFNPKDLYNSNKLSILGEFIGKLISTDKIILFQCRTGEHRSTVGMILTVLISYHKEELKFVDDNGNEIPVYTPTANSNVNVNLDMAKSPMMPKVSDIKNLSSFSLKGLESPDNSNSNTFSSPSKVAIFRKRLSVRDLPNTTNTDDNDTIDTNATDNSNTNNNNNDNNNSNNMDTNDNNENKNHGLSLDMDSDDDSQTESNNDNSDETVMIECHGVLTLIRLLRNGLMMKLQVDNAIELCAQYYHIKNRIYDARAKWESARTDTERNAYLMEAIRHFKIYTNLILFNAYYFEYQHAFNANKKGKKKYKLLSFEEWISSRPEIDLWKQGIDDNPELAISMNQQTDDNPYFEDVTNENEQKVDEDADLISRAISERGKESNVLLSNAMLKTDYFPGCRQLTPLDTVPSGINFRYITDIGVGGCAIPLTEAITEMIHYISLEWKNSTHIKKSKKPTIRWVNLREEPVCYIKGEPVVLRDVSTPYENLIFTGITTKRVQAMEKSLKKDATGECERFDGKLLVHSESDTGQLEPTWQKVSTIEIQTTAEAYRSEFHKQRFNIDAKYFRRPITDEQAPTSDDFDQFIRIFEDEPIDSFYMFNCQMGRGRTTTGMVIYSLWKRRCNLIKFNPTPSNSNNNSNNSSSITDQKVKSLLNGEFDSVLRLLSMLPQGKIAKKWLDELLDILDHMQNLRTAIYQMKQRASKTIKEKSKKLLYHRSDLYLRRYCSLIAFASYLLTEYKIPNKIKAYVNKSNNNSNNNNIKRNSFKNWLESRTVVNNFMLKATISHDN